MINRKKIAIAILNKTFLVVFSGAITLTHWIIASRIQRAATILNAVINVVMTTFDTGS